MVGRLAVATALTIATAASCACVVPMAPPGNASNANVKAVEEAPTKAAKPDVAGDAPRPASGSKLEAGLHALVFERPGAELPVNYLLFLPENYEAGARWPVLVYLHGKSLSGDDPQMLTRYGPPRLVGRDPSFPFILVAPQVRAGARWTDVETLDDLLEEILEGYPVDPERVYLVGYSMGAGGVWRFGGAKPERFAAVVAIAGTKDLGRAKGLARVPVWAFHGTDDDVTPASNSEEMVAAIRAAGGDVRLELLPGRDHNIVDVFERKDLYTWLLEHRRQFRCVSRPALWGRVLDRHGVAVAVDEEDHRSRTIAEEQARVLTDRLARDERPLLRQLRVGLLESEDAAAMGTWDHGGGFSLDASVRVEAHDRQGLERLLRYCARPAFALERLREIDAERLVYESVKPGAGGSVSLMLTPLELIERLAALIAPNAPLRSAVTALAGC